jgi:hypothetical protein
MAETKSADGDGTRPAEARTEDELRPRLSQGGQQKQNRGSSMQVSHEGPSFAAEREMKTSQRPDYNQIIGGSGFRRKREVG